MKRWLPFILVVLFAGLTAAQTAIKTDAEKAADRKEAVASLTDLILTDAAGLVLGENRSYVNARVGALLCKSDPKTAASMFQTSINELVSAQSTAEAESRSRSSRLAFEIRISQSIRTGILTTIAGCDAGFALDSLFRTRSTSIQRALAQAGDPTAKISDTTGYGQQFVRNELGLEQKLTALAAAQDPALAVKMLQDSIKRGISGETLGLLKKLFEKDPASANSLAADVLDRLQSSTFSNGPGGSDELALTFNILNDYTRDKKPGAKTIKFEDLQIRSLAQKLINFAIIPDQRFPRQRFSAVITLAEKFLPASVAALKKVQKAAQGGTPRGVMDPDVRQVIDSRSTPAQMLNDAKRFPADSRGPIYQSAAGKIALEGDLEGARGLLNANFSGYALESAEAQVNSAYAAYLSRQGRFADAERFIDEFPEATRRTSLIGLATAAFRKDREEYRSFAVGVLRKVRTIMPDRPANAGELSQFMQLASAYSAIEPDEAFAIVEPLVQQLNELADATAVVQAYQNTLSVRSGEFEIAAGGSYGFAFDAAVLRALAKADLEKTNKLIDTFARREIRIAFRLQLAENLPK